MKLYASHRMWTVFRPQADEKRFLMGLVVLSIFLIPFWGKGYLHFMGPQPLLATDFIAWLIYLLVFWKRLKYRGELGRAILGPALFFGLLLGIALY